MKNSSREFSKSFTWGSKLSLLFLFLIFFLSIFFSISLVNAQPPFVQVGEFTTGYEIKYPPVGIIKQAEAFDFHFHVFNISNGMPITQGINCTFHLYNSSGNHLLFLYDDTASNTYDYEFTVPGSNFIETGYYSYIAQCNNSAFDLGGFVSAELEVVGAKGGVDNRTFLVFMYGFAMVLLMFAVISSNEYMGFMSGGLFIVAGVYLMVYGFSTISDIYTQSISFVSIGFGAVLFLAAGYKVAEGILGEERGF